MTPSADELPSFTPQPRVYQATAGPPQPVADPVPPAAEAQLPTRTPGETLPTRTPGETPLPGRHPVDGPPHARPPRPRQPGPPVYSDLLAPAPGAGPHTPMGAPPPPGEPPPGAPHSPGRAGAPYAPAGQPPWHPASAPPDEAPGGPYVPQQRMGGFPGEGDPTFPPAGAPGPGGGEERGTPGKSGPSTGLIVGAVLVGATLLVVGALGVTFLLGQLRGSTGSATYQVGDCVVQDGDAAQPAECSEPGAYEIVAQVDSQEDCGDPTQPAIEVAGPPAQFFCLTPAAGSGEPDGAEPSGEPDQDE